MNTASGSSLAGSVVRVALATATVLLLPLAAMRFTDEVNWTFADFAVAGLLLFGTGLAYVLAVRSRVDRAYRAAMGIAAGGVLLLTWANLAVGVVGSEANPLNRAFFAVPAVALVGAAWARFGPRGMASTMIATALVVVAIAAVALYPGVDLSSSARFEILGVSGFFIGLFLLAAALFRRSDVAARK